MYREINRKISTLNCIDELKREKQSCKREFGLQRRGLQKLQTLTGMGRSPTLEIKLEKRLKKEMNGWKR